MKTISKFRPHNRAWLNSFRYYLEAEQGLSTNTVDSYFQDCQEFLNTLNCKIEDVRAKDLVEYLADLQKIGFAGSSIARKRSSIKNLLRFLLEENVKLNLNLAEIPSIKYKHTLPDVLSLKEMLKLLDNIARETPLDWRNKAMIELMYATGIRVSETINLTIHDVYWKEEVIRVLGKGRKQRVIPVAQKSLDFLKTYTELYRPLLKKYKEEDRLFLNRLGNHLSRMGIWKILEKLALQANIDKRVSPHTIRHSFATHLVQAGANLRIVQILLGHASINTTQIYSNIDKSFIIKEHRLYHPRR